LEFSNSLILSKLNNIKHRNISTKFFTTINNDSTTNPPKIDIDKRHKDDEMSEAKKKIQIDKKKIFNKKSHWRNIDIDLELDPSKDMEEQDKREYQSFYMNNMMYDKYYMKIMNDWQKNLFRNKKKKAKTKLDFENYVY
jgi:hypothetical protein